MWPTKLEILLSGLLRKSLLNPDLESRLYSFLSHTDFLSLVEEAKQFSCKVMHILNLSDLFFFSCDVVKLVSLSTLFLNKLEVRFKILIRLTRYMFF